MNSYNMHLFNLKLKTLKEQIDAVKQDGYLIRFIKNPCLEVQTEAVKESGWAIQCIKSPFPEVQKIYFLFSLKENRKVNYKHIKDLDPAWVQNMIDCKDILE